MATLPSGHFVDFHAGIFIERFWDFYAQLSPPWGLPLGRLVLFLELELYSRVRRDEVKGYRNSMLIKY